MRNLTSTMILAAALVTAAAAGTTLYADDAPSGSMMRGGPGNMMRGEKGGMPGQMSRMMDHCGGMMAGGSRGNRPNDQWRKPSPDTPGNDG